MDVNETTINDTAKPLGFWTCWSLTVGIMIGSGIFLLPSVLAPYGIIGFGGWAVTSLGAMALALVIARLASRTKRSGGVYRYTKDAFGDFSGFLIAWGYWASYWIAIPAMAIAFVGYASVFFPTLQTNTTWQAATALGLIWTVTLINLRGLKETGRFQILTTFLKLTPFVLIVGWALIAGDTENLPRTHSVEGSYVSLIAASALLTMWAFAGLEAGTFPADDVRDPQRTIPRAIVMGTITVAFIYVASTYAVMLLVPSDILASSTSPFADAASGLGSWGPAIVAIGAMIATAGALNGTIFITGQLPLAVAMDGLAPKVLAKKSSGGTAPWPVLLSSLLGSILLLTNYAAGVLAVFELLITMSTLTLLIPLLASALAEFKFSFLNKQSSIVIAVVAAAYSVFTILGSGMLVIGWGVVLFAAGLPVYWLGRRAARDTDDLDGEVQPSP